MHKHQWDRASFWLHCFFAITVITQLSTSQFMGNASSFAHELFTVHIVSGISTLILMIIFVIMKLSQHKFISFYPWYGERFMEVIADIKNLLKLKLPQHETRGLPASIQGLGILLIIGMALSGGTGYFLYQYTAYTNLAHELISLHKTLANLVWIYIIGHAGMAIIHRVVEHFQQARN